MTIVMLDIPRKLYQWISFEYIIMVNSTRSVQTRGVKSIVLNI